MKTLVILITFILINNYLYSQWENISGPYGGEVWELKQFGEYIFAATQTGGVFRSSDGGLNWEPLTDGLNGYGVYSLAYTGNILLAGSANGIFTSENNGNTWESTNSPEDIIYGIAVQEGTGNDIFAAGLDGIYISTNNGADWSLTSQHAESFSVICIGDTVIAGTSDGLCRSTDRGATWNCLFSTIPFDFIKMGSTIYAGTSNGVFWESIDYGNSWTVIGQLSSAGFRSLASSESSGGTKFYGGTIDGIWVSSDYGHNWTKSSGAAFGLYCFINALIFSDGQLLAGSCTGVYRSDTSAVNWTNSDLINYSIIGGMTTNGSSIFSAGLFGGIFRSTDNGINWNQVNNGITNTKASDIITAPDGSGGVKLIGGTEGGVYTSYDNGSTWNYSSLGNKAVNSLLAYNNNGNPELFIATEGSGVYRSTDNGINWINISLGLDTYFIRSLTSVDSFVFVGSHHRDFGAYRYNVNGMGWTQLPGLNGTYIKCIYATEERMFAGTLSSYTGGCFKYSTNQGIGWNTYPNCHPEEVNAMISVGIDLFAGTADSGVYISRDNGLNWLAVNEGMPESITVDAFCVSDSFLFAGSGSKGMWRRPLSEILTGGDVNTPVLISYSLVQNYPNPFNPSTNIKYSIPEYSTVVIKVFDVLGNEIATLVNEEKPVGTYEVIWNATGLPSGVYFCQLKSAGYVETKKMILVK